MQTAADPSVNPPKFPEKQTVDTVTASHRMLSLQALSSSLNAGTAKRGFLGQGKAFGRPPAIRPPKRPRPFARCRQKKRGLLGGSAGILQNITPFLGTKEPPKKKTHKQKFHGIVPGIFLGLCLCVYPVSPHKE